MTKPMKMPLDPQHLELPVALAYQIAGAFFSGVGVLATTFYGCYHKLAVLSTDELAIQPLHVVLIGFIIALATFIALILRAVWSRGIPTIEKITDAIVDLKNVVKGLDDNISGLRKDHQKSVDKYEDLALDALKGGVKASKPRN